MNQYERLVQYQKKNIRVKILSIILSVVIIVLGLILWLFMISKNYNTYFIVLVMFILPCIIIMLFIIYIEKSLWWFEEWRWYIKILNKWENAVIEINNVNKDILDENIKEFLAMYDNKSILEKNYKFQIKSVWSKYYLIFEQPIEFKTFIYWVNYLSFINNWEYNVMWRFPSEITASWILKPITRGAQKNMMVFCKNDVSNDINNVYCFCDNWLFLKKFLYVNLWDIPPYYKYINLTNKNPWFEYREMPRI